MFMFRFESNNVCSLLLVDSRRSRKLFKKTTRIHNTILMIWILVIKIVLSWSMSSNNTIPNIPKIRRRKISHLSFYFIIILISAILTIKTYHKTKRQTQEKHNTKRQWWFKNEEQCALQILSKSSRTTMVKTSPPNTPSPHFQAPGIHPRFPSFPNTYRLYNKSIWRPSNHCYR